VYVLLYTNELLYINISVQEGVLGGHIEALAAGGARHDLLHPRLDGRELVQIQICIWKYLWK